VCVLARKVVQTKLVVKLGSPPAQCKEYADLLISYFLANLETQKEKAGERGSSCTSSVVAAKARFLASARSFFSIFNGELWEGDKLIHYCTGADCCPGSRPENGWKPTKKRCLHALIDFVFTGAITTPETGKWTKVGPALDGLLRGQVVHKLYAQSFEAAFSSLSVKLVMPAAGEGEDQAFVEDVMWSEVAGRRARGALRLLQDQESLACIWRIALSTEPSRHFTRILLTLSKETACQLDPPPLCTLATPQASPIVRILQYYSSFLSDNGKENCRLLMYAMFLGCASCADALASHPGDLSKMRREVLVAASWLHRYHMYHLQDFPWKLAVTADSRCDQEHRRSVVQEALGAPGCCLDEHFTRRLRSLSDLRDLLEDGTLLTAQVKAWAARTSVTTALVELKHAKHKHMVSSKCSAWHHFAARALNSAAASILAQYRDRLSDGSEGAQICRRAKERRAVGFTPLHSFWRVVKDRECAMGKRVNPASKHFWAMVKSEWAALDDEDPVKVACVAASHESKASALAKRAQQQHSSAQLCSQPTDLIGDLGWGGEKKPKVAVSHHGSPPDLLVPWCHGANLEATLEQPFGLGTDVTKYPISPLHIGRDDLVEKSVMKTDDSWRSLTSHVVKPHGIELGSSRSSQCGKSLCSSTASADLLLMHSDFVTQLAHLGKAHGRRPFLLLVCDVSLRGDGDGFGDQKSRYYAHVPTSLPAAGSHEFRMNIIECDTIGDDVENCSALMCLSGDSPHISIL